MRRIKHPNTIGRKHCTHNVYERGLAGVDVANDERHDVEGVKLAHRIQQSADQGEQIGIHHVVVELVTDDLIEPGGVERVESAWLIDVMPWDQAVLKHLGAHQLSVDEIEDPIGKTQVTPIAPSQRKVDVIHLLHVQHHLVEPPRLCAHQGIVGPQLLAHELFIGADVGIGMRIPLASHHCAIFADQSLRFGSRHHCIDEGGHRIGGIVGKGIK